jgi:hypothetical protein
MKRLILILAICIAIPSISAFGLNTTTKHQDSIRKATTVQHEKVQKKNQPAKTVYTCPMHPEVMLEKPAKCPKCRMILVKKVQVVKIVSQNK